MKKSIVLLAFCALVAACSLDEKVVSYPLPETYYKTPEQCITGLNACYGNIRSIYNSTGYFAVCELQTDLMYINRANMQDAILLVSPSAPQFGTTMWTQGYQGVSRVNSVEAAIKRSPMSEAEKAPLLAEATVLRSMFYYILTSNFGDVPFYKEEVTASTNDKIAMLPRMSAKATRDTLIADLQYWILEKQALDMAPTNSAQNRQQYRAGAALGCMLGGKLCLWNERWNDAINFFEALEQMYGDLSSYKLSDIPFGKRLTAESIFEMSNISVDYGLHVTGNLASLCTPYRKASTTELDTEEEDSLDDSDYYDGVGIPELGNDMRTQDPYRPTRRFYRELMPSTSTDHRRAAYDVDGNLIEDGGGYLAWGWPGYQVGDDRTVAEPKYLFFNRTKNSSGQPHLGNKFWCFGMHYNNDSNSYKLFRYAGAILGLAEAWFQKGGNDAKACSYLNMVKSRAGIETVNPSSFATRNDLFHEIQDEYGRELFGEFQRKHDLVRWGIWYDYVVKYNAEGCSNTRLKANIKPCHEYYPIPDQQIVNSGGHLDNEEYNRYGL